MKIVLGRGNKRKVALELPNASIVNRSSDAEIKQVGAIVCDLLHIPPVVEAPSAVAA